MSIKQPIKAKNDKQNKIEKIKCDCGLLWSMAHQFTYLRLSDEITENEYELVDLFAARAKRIAATYARFYLETEDGGDKSKIGRYYWMALGAFASKTVGCLLDTVQLNAMYVGFKTIPRGLGQGNLWLFTDIAASHWFYSHYPENFHEGMRCGKNRNVNELEDTVKKNTYELPWADKSISKIKNFKPSDDITEGFGWIKKIESEGDEDIIHKHQLKQLIAIAKHEQGYVLQPLIYDDSYFAGWAKFQRWPGIKYLGPKYQLTFTHACEVSDDDFKSLPPKGMEIENLVSRMDWINRAADKFHDLMLSRNGYMKQELEAIAGWVDSPDAKSVY